MDYVFIGNLKISSFGGVLVVGVYRVGVFGSGVGISGVFGGVFEWVVSGEIVVGKVGWVFWGVRKRLWGWWFVEICDWIGWCCYWLGIFDIVEDVVRVYDSGNSY